MIVDSGERREFETGAVRDVSEGRGRCDLLPLDVVASVMACDTVLSGIAAFCTDGKTSHLESVLSRAVYELNMFDCLQTLILEVSIHFEEGAKKYGEWNWQKGIPVHCYIDSAVRHYLKWCRGDKDERHDRAFAWNIMCCLWTLAHKPELNDLEKKE